MANTREATVEDAPACAAVHVASWKAGYEGILPADYLKKLTPHDRLSWWANTLKRSPADRRLRVVVVEDAAGRVCGFGSTTQPENGHAELAQLYVAPSAWSTGAADALVTTLLGDLRSQDIDVVSLRVAGGNGRACRFYERNGWTPVEDSQAVEEVWGVQVPTVEYRRRLMDQ